MGGALLGEPDGDLVGAEAEEVVAVEAGCERAGEPGCVLVARLEADEVSDEVEDERGLALVELRQRLVCQAKR